MAATDRRVSPISGARQAGLLTAGGFPGDDTPGASDTLGAIEPLGILDAADPIDPIAPPRPVPSLPGPIAPPGPVGAPPGPIARPGAGSRPAPAATPGIAGAPFPAGRSPCGTGWPDRPPRGTGWPLGSPLSAPARERGQARRSQRHETSCALSSQLGSVSLAREFARATVAGWGLPELCDDVTAVVSELVTNALRYGLTESGYGLGEAGRGALTPAPDALGPTAPQAHSVAPGWRAGACRKAGPIELRLMLRSADVICMVADPGTGVPALTDPGHFAEGGRGLHVVQSCSDRWGWDPLAGGGKVVWAAFHL